MNPDKLRMQPKAVEFVKHFIDTGKPDAAICHGPWTLIEADAVRGHTVTSWPSLKTDSTNAGANWVDQEVVGDGRLVTSRKPDDIPAFNREMNSAIQRTGGRRVPQGCSATRCWRNNPANPSHSAGFLLLRDVGHL